MKADLSSTSRPLAPFTGAAPEVRAALRRPVLEAAAADDENGAARVPERCANCGAERAGAYCHACGQEYLGGRLTLRRFWHEFAARYLKLESGLWRTFREMWTDPGGVARRYACGQRRRYTNPLGYFLLAATVSLFSFILVQDVFVERVAEQNRYAFEDQNPQEREVMTSLFGEDPARGLAEGMVAIQKRTNTYAMLILCVFFALTLRLFFSGPKQGGWTLAEMLVFAVFSVAQVILLGSFLNMALLALPISMNVFFVVGTLGYALFIGWAALGFFQRSVGTFGLAVLAYVVAYAVFMLVFVVMFIAFVVYTYLQNVA